MTGRHFVAVLVLAVVAAVMFAGSAAAFAGANGKLLFLSNRSGDREIYLVNRQGSGLQRLTFNNIFERAAAWSPDGKSIVSTGFVGGNGDIYTIKADGSGLRRLTTDPARDDDPAWTADGTRIVYDRGFPSCTPCSLRIVNADGSGDRALDVGRGNSFGPETSPRGNQIAFANDRSGVFAIYATSLSGGAVRQVTPGSPGFDFDPRWSPEGNDIVFVRGDDATGDNDLYVVHSNGTGLRRLTATPSRAEFQAAWAPDGSEISFFANDGHVYVMRPDGTGETRLSTIPLAPFEETFNDGIVDNSLWHTISDSGGSIGEVNGQLHAFISHDADPTIHNYNQVDEHIGSQCTLNGDLDFQADYELVIWPPHNGFFAMLNAIFGDGAIARTSAPWDPPYDEQYNAWTNGATFTSGQINTTDTSGQLRLVRRTGVLYAYERPVATADWILVHTGDATGNVVAAMGLWAPESSFAHKDGLVAYDNFHLSSGVFTCPTWWNDAWPDWQALSTGDGD